MSNRSPAWVSFQPRSSTYHTALAARGRLQAVLDRLNPAAGKLAPVRTPAEIAKAKKRNKNKNKKKKEDAAKGTAEPAK